MPPRDMKRAVFFMSKEKQQQTDIGDSHGVKGSVVTFQIFRVF